MYIGRQPQKEGSYRKVDAFVFNGVLTTFDLEISGRAIIPGTAENLMVVVNDIILEPGVDYTVSGSEITFAAAHTTGLSHHCVYLGDSYKAPDLRPVTLDDLTNVTISGATADDVLKWNGSAWVNSGTIGTTHIENLDGLTIGTKTTNDILMWNGTAWVNEQFSLSDLSDIDVTSTPPITDDILTWNGSEWVPIALSYPTVISDLTDVSPIAPSIDDLLVWDGATWVPVAPAGGSPHPITSHNDYNGTPTDGQALVWDAATSKWIPGTIESGGGSSVETVDTLEIFISSLGNDVTGTGESATPFATVNRALLYAKDFVVLEKILITIPETSGDIIESQLITINFPVPVVIMPQAYLGWERIDFSGDTDGSAFVPPGEGLSSMFAIHSTLVIDSIELKNTNSVGYDLDYFCELYDNSKVRLNGVSILNISAITYMQPNKNRCEEFIIEKFGDITFSNIGYFSTNRFYNVGKLELGTIDADHDTNNIMHVNFSTFSGDGVGTAFKYFEIFNCADVSFAITVDGIDFRERDHSAIYAENSHFKIFRYIDYSGSGSHYIPPINLITFKNVSIDSLYTQFGNYEQCQFIKFDATHVKSGEIGYSATNIGYTYLDCPFYLDNGTDINLYNLTHLIGTSYQTSPSIWLNNHSKLFMECTTNFAYPDSLPDLIWTSETLHTTINYGNDFSYCIIGDCVDVGGEGGCSCGEA